MHCGHSIRSPHVRHRVNGGIAAAVEEEERLLAGDVRLAQRGDQRRAEPAPARRGVGAEVDRVDPRQLCAAEPRRQLQLGIAPAGDLDLRFDRRGRGGEDDGRGLEAGAHHRDVAAVVLDAVVLLEPGVVRLVDDDQPQVGEVEEQRRPGPDDDPRLAARRRPPRPAALAPAHLAVPWHRRDAEARGEAVQPRRGQRDLGNEHQRLAPGPERGGDAFEIDLGLARPGYPVEDEGGEAPLADRARDVFGGDCLFVAQHRLRRSRGRAAAAARRG